MKILSIVGARPNFIKIAPLLAEMRRHSGIEPALVHTGQHYDPKMSDDVFRDLEIPPPDFHLAVGRWKARRQITEIVRRLEPILHAERPDVVIVVGDVNSTVAGAMAAVRHGVPVAHVEAGLRSFDRRMPEEINRLLTDAISDLLFVSEPSGVRNLRREGRSPRRIHLVGNVMIDTLRKSLSRARSTPALVDLGLAQAPRRPPQRPYALLTIHRQALVDRRALLAKVWQVLEDIGRHIPVIFPVHPRTRQRLRQARLTPPPGAEAAPANTGIRLVPPLGYLEFLCVESAASMVLTDSGGVQEETTALGVPCLTLRETTERPITVTEGTNRLVGLDPGRIREEAFALLAGRRQDGRVPDLWDGHASRRIVGILRRHFSSRPGSGAELSSPADAVSPAAG